MSIRIQGDTSHTEQTVFESIHDNYVWQRISLRTNLQICKIFARLYVAHSIVKLKKSRGAWNSKQGSFLPLELVLQLDTFLLQKELPRVGFETLWSRQATWAGRTQGLSILIQHKTQGREGRPSSSVLYIMMAMRNVFTVSTVYLKELTLIHHLIMPIVTVLQTCLYIVTVQHHP